jgi:hypothetical protein
MRVAIIWLDFLFDSCFFCFIVAQNLKIIVSNTAAFPVVRIRHVWKRFARRSPIVARPNTVRSASKRPVVTETSVSRLMLPKILVPKRLNPLGVARIPSVLPRFVRFGPIAAIAPPPLENGRRSVWIWPKTLA